MDDLIGIQQNADMCDPSFLIIEKGQIARPRLLQETHCLALTGLLRGVPQQVYAEEFEDALGEPAAVYTKDASSTPEIGRIQVFVRKLADRFRIGAGGRRIPDLAFIMDLVL